MLDPESLVIRGGAMADEYLLINAQTAYESPRFRGQWILSAVSLPDQPAEEIVRLSPQITQAQYHVTTAGQLIDAGFPAVEQNPPHAQILLNESLAGEPPTHETWETLRFIFGEGVDNPFYPERKRSGAKR